MTVQVIDLNNEEIITTDEEETLYVVVGFTQSIDNDDYKFSNKKEAIVKAQSLTSNKTGNYDFVNDDSYKYMLFTEYVVTMINKKDAIKYPLYTLISDVEPEIPEGVFSFVYRLKNYK